VGSDGANSTIRNLTVPDAESLDFGGDYVGLTINIDHGIPVQEMAVFYDTSPADFVLSRQRRIRWRW
jgi:2-polyprenyl-6-methoxyphenol hydroxylase-like FAD-dependent oxidoreductase